MGFCYLPAEEEKRREHVISTVRRKHYFDCEFARMEKSAGIYPEAEVDLFMKTEFAKKKKKEKKRENSMKVLQTRLLPCGLVASGIGESPLLEKKRVWLLWELMSELCLGNASATKIFVNLDIPETQEFKIRQADDEGPVELLAEMESSQFQLNSTGDHQFGRAR
ncbi:ABC transporter G family member 36 [Corchorus capsularis]|uniref:ABC transporter G family member 36 n=1 Tax=Corchorus capsularis TaxID=210143 RepID=A0A1R3FXP0_COCAP|nr:ABC transporter G family member 36 [Corchorus capsularis]